MNAERLLTLAEFLETKVPDEHFRLHVFTRNADNGDHAFERLPLVLSGESRGCGAAGCAIGWCPGAFPDDWEWKDDDDDGIEVRLKGYRFDPDHGWDWRGAEQFFGLSGQQCSWLFVPGSGYTSRLDVAARIREFVATGLQDRSTGT